MKKKEERRKKKKKERRRREYLIEYTYTGYGAAEVE